MEFKPEKSIVCNHKLILGSASPRRKELLEGLGFQFEINPIHANEDFPIELNGMEITMYLAEKKSNSYSSNLKENELLITADTVVWIDNEVLNKPKDREEATRMLRQLSGKKHEVYTGVCLRTTQKKKLFCEKSDVYFKQLSKAEIDFYVDNYPVYDKAGSYGVQDWIGFIGIERIDGSFYNVMGLPVKKTFEEIINF